MVSLFWPATFWSVSAAPTSLSLIHIYKSHPIRDDIAGTTQSIAKSKGYRLDDACAMPLVAFFDRRQSENAAENGNGRCV